MGKAMLLLVLLAIALPFFLFPRQAAAGEVDILVTKLVEKGVLTPVEAQTILDETRKEVSKELSAGKSYSAPEWTQKIKMGGDMRFRTQTDWGKGLDPAHSRVRERVRARFGVEGKVNDQITAGARLATGGSSDPRSTNITLGDNAAGGDFAKTAIDFDKYYIEFKPTYEYLKGSDFWFGKFGNPFVKTELLWDDDINPEGIGIQYISSSFDIGGLPKTKLYANGGMLWLLEIARADTDPMLWGAQAGITSELYPKWGIKLDVCASYYDFTRMKNRNWSSSATAGTNSLQTAGDAGNNSAYIGTLRYDYNLFDLVAKIDNKSLFGLVDLPNGLYGDFVYNGNAASSNTGYLLGGYLGTRKISEFGQWNAWFEWRYIGRDCVPDILPDSDFYGFTVAGAPKGGGTNGRGINTGLQFGLFNNTWLNLEYYWTEPIKTANMGQGTSSMTTPYQLFQFDINTKF